MDRKILTGRWNFRQVGEDAWMTGYVPGCNYLDLMRNKTISDPLKGLNENDVQWVADKDWEYERNFYLKDEDFEYDRIYLSCKMLDTLCDIYINERLSGKSDNCFLEYREDVKKYLCVGENRIRFVFHSPVKYVKEKYKKCPAPVNSNGLNGIVHIRKPQCHFGWDWGPCLPVSGISGNICLEFAETAEINGIDVEQRHSDNRVDLHIDADVKSISDSDYSCEISLYSPKGELIEAVKNASADFCVENPELWWTRELSGNNVQPLYSVKARIFNSDGKIVDEKEIQIGLRVIELNRENDKYGQNFQFRLNGVPVFIKGANYIPPDSFITRFDSKRLNDLINAVQFSNMNMIRVWGGGYYGSDEFYSLCDKRGILVWQDFQFACQAYPFFNDEFLENVKNEVAYNVNRIKNHPSLALWCGNNEIEDMHMAWVHMTKYVDYTEKFFYGILEPEIRKNDNQTPYIPGSPIGTSHNKGVHSDNVGDTHLWGVWHGLQPMNFYRKRMTRFCSEFGFESLPDLKTIQEFAQPADYSLSSAVFKSHQKCANGNDKMIYYIASRFNLPERFKDYIYLSQITQQECIADATEHWRRNKGRCNGAMYWQLNDCWGCCSWSSYDFYGNYKALQYKARHFNAPLSVSIEDTPDFIKIVAINDYNNFRNVKAEYEIFDFENGVVDKKCYSMMLSPLENRDIFFLDMDSLKKNYDLKRTGLRARLFKGEKLVNEKVLLFDNEKNLSLPKAKLKCKITVRVNSLTIDVTSDKYARFVKLDCANSTEPFSDNFFDILPGETKRVTIRKDRELELMEQAKAISVYSLCNIKPSNNRLDTKLKQMKVFLSPVNIANAVHHGKASGDD
ncbi:MAG: glycoside hydrolase family 2 TIM barrel-domain containing protein [Eubacteriales bacterium]|nr:glycoside hydrolase family 2 TIM barrel-domain containing protein [Eubacteriales bacterium]